MNASHGGFKNAFDHLFQANDGGKRKGNWPVVIVSSLKVGIILFCTTLFTWTNNPDDLAVAGLVAVMALSATSVLNHIFIHKNALVEEATERATKLVRQTTRRMLTRVSEGDE